MLPAIAAAHVRLDYAHLRSRNVKCLRKLVANAKGPLRSRPDSHLVAVPLSHSGTRLKRSVGDVLNGVARFQLYLRCIHSLSHRAHNMLRPIIAAGLRIVLQILEEITI
jgi:hypothetical protein